jgi:protein-S-isoprenylcysteine O-methyltransferase Ste14
VQTLLWLAAMGALLFLPAGGLHWPGAWAFLAEMAGLGLASGLWLARRDPGLLAERLAPPLQRQQSPADRALMAVFLLLWVGWLAAMGFETRWHGPAQLPPWAQAVGALLVALGLGIACLAFRANSFAVPVVKLQKDRGQRVATGGAYGWVRHPMYAGALVFLLGTPLLLGAWRGLAWVPVLGALLAWRIVLEENLLRAGLEGYAEYAARVRYRLIPGIW